MPTDPTAPANLVDQLLRQARYPLGPQVTVVLDESGPLAELALLLTAVNGFTVFNAGVQVFHAGSAGLGPELAQWNTPGSWKETYNGLADGLFCFGQDLCGRQFAVEHQEHVVLFDPETAERTRIGTCLQDWAAWLLADPERNACRGYATTWQDRYGALTHDQRLIPLRFFNLGGTYDFDNIVAKPAAECMRIRGPLAQQLHQLPDGVQVNLMTERPPTTNTDTEQHAYAELDVFADYNAFVVQDEAAQFAPDRQWTRALITDLVATAPGAIGVGTARRTTVPVILDIRATEPDINPDDWDHITEAGLHTETGRLLVSAFDYTDNIPRTPIPAGDYTARIYYRGLRTISPDGRFGNDLYRVVLWPGEPRPPRVIKRFDGELPGG
ncbi:hypothetical protein [Amycolatopsis sp. GM8]|uniref:hypothetical protein n=1 Tax=Amycolatopsis sp. GM8 TaxID=2896530 RepID=UPI001F37A9EB|nr:hypothetical protein [Amycolatopsis sp. GM8]